MPRSGADDDEVSGTVSSAAPPSLSSSSPESYESEYSLPLVSSLSC